MDVLVLVIEIVLCLFSVFMVAVVLLQSGKSAGLSGDIAGGAETFLGKSKAKSYEGTLKKLTKVAAVGIMVLAVVLVLIQVYLPGDTTESDTTTIEASATPEPLTVPDDTASVIEEDAGSTATQDAGE
ncbi:MAG: preprotein translocase subunit SecG [Eubacteriales bacterium]|nr:preprotein translocase subunit SecG [Eubacteriales bacterium]